MSDEPNADIDLFDVVLPPLPSSKDRRYYTAVKQEEYLRLRDEHSAMWAALDAIRRGTAGKKSEPLATYHALAVNTIGAAPDSDVMARFTPPTVCKKHDESLPCSICEAVA